MFGLVRIPSQGLASGVERISFLPFSLSLLDLCSRILERFEFSLSVNAFKMPRQVVDPRLSNSNFLRRYFEINKSTEIDGNLPLCLWRFPFQLADPVRNSCKFCTFWSPVHPCVRNTSTAGQAHRLRLPIGLVHDDLPEFRFQYRICNNNQLIVS